MNYVGKTFVGKTFRLKLIFDRKKFWSEKNLVKNNVGGKKFGQEKFW